jgi:hypothetical protein
MVSSGRMAMFFCCYFPRRGKSYYIGELSITTIKILIFIKLHSIKLSTGEKESISLYI